MSVQINCDRCGIDTRLHFGNADLAVTRGGYGNTQSPYRNPWRKRWHLCEKCIGSLKDWCSSSPETDEA